MSIRKSRLPGFILMLLLTNFGLMSPGSPMQRKTDEDRRRALQQVLDKMKEKGEQGIKPVPGQPAQAAPAQAAPGPAPAAPATAPAPIPSIVQRAPLSSEQVQLTYDNADLYDFINQIASTLGITPIVIDPEVKGTVTIHSSAPMSKQDIFPLFNMILKNNNAALVKQGNIYQIVPISAALKRGLEVIEHLPPPSPPPSKQEAPPAAKPVPANDPPAGQPRATAAPEGDPQTTQAQAPPGPAVAVQPAPVPGQTPAAPARPAQADAGVPRLATHVIRPEFVPVGDLIEPLKLFMTDGGVIMPYPRLNMLIVTDYSDSVAKILEVVNLLDNSYLDADLIELIKINYNASADVLADLQKIFGGGQKDSATGIYFVSLDRMNALLVMASSKRALEEVKRWIAELDAPTGRSVQTFVYTVENSTAANIATIIAALYGGEGSSGGGGSGAERGGAGPFGAARTSQSGTQGGTTTAGPFGSTASSSSGSFGGGTFGGSQYGGGTFGGGTFGGGGFGGGAFGQGGYGGMGGFFGGGQQLGPRLNQGPSVSAQVLRGGAFLGLQGEVRIVTDEINNSLIIQASPADYRHLSEVIKKMDVLPRQAIIDARIFEVDLTDTFSFGISAQLQARDASANRLTTGKTDATTGALTANTFAFIGNAREILLALDALRAKTNVRILEAPSVLALDGTVARITVGGEVPYPGTSFVSGVGGTTTSVQYRDTGVSLIVMPRISASGTVTLDVAQEISSAGAPTTTGPTFNKTSVSTTLAVRDGETVAIAGLIRDSNNSARSGIPFLSEIPLLGSLFGRTNRTATRSEILILITPHVIRTPERFQEMTQELKDSLRNVRKLVDDKRQQHIDDMEDARKDRYREQESLRKQQEDRKKQVEPKQQEQSGEPEQKPPAP